MPIVKSIALAALLLAGTAADASSAGTGHITSLIALDNGGQIFYHDGSRTGTPDCASSQPTRWVIDGSTASGKVKVAHLLTAYTLQKPISIQGKASCQVWFDTETVDYASIVDQ